MATRDLDRFILASVDSHWQKVAMVIARALTDPDLEFPETDDDALFVASRVEVLVALGQLEAQGDTGNWGRVRFFVCEAV